MKSLFTFLFVICLSQLFAQDKMLVFSGKACSPNESPLILKQGDVVEIGCDTAVLMNMYRYQLYEKAREMILKSDRKNLDALIQAYESSFSYMQGSYDSLLAHYYTLDQSFRNYLTDNKEMLNNSRTDLSQATQSLQQANQLLDEAIKQVNGKKHRHLLKYIGGIAIGFSAGILTGVLVD